MNVNDKFFSFPPHLSTPWAHVIALSVSPSGHMIFHLISRDAVVLPLLTKDDTDRIFKAHASFLERQVLEAPPERKERFIRINDISPEGREIPIRFAFGTLEGLNSAMQHNPQESNSPNLPAEILTKIAEVSKILAPNDPNQLPKAEPHCNCPHCQIARAVRGTPPLQLQAEIEEEVPLEDLQFEQWGIKQTGDKLFTVSNKLDPLESYSVYLGHPVGCTCGKQGCEHILVVLKS
jgi:hypothetical protein